MLQTESSSPAVGRTLCVCDFNKAACVCDTVPESVTCIHRFVATAILLSHLFMTAVPQASTSLALLTRASATLPRVLSLAVTSRPPSGSRLQQGCLQVRYRARGCDLWRWCHHQGRLGPRCRRRRRRHGHVNGHFFFLLNEIKKKEKKRLD